jgi:hypothetical protein
VNPRSSPSSHHLYRPAEYVTDESSEQHAAAATRSAIAILSCACV